MNNKKDPNEQIAFKLFNAKLLDENKFNILRQLIAEQNDEILELFKLYMNLGNDLKKLSIQINNTFTFLFKKKYWRNESSNIYWSYFFSFCSFNYYLSKSLFYR